MIIDPEKMDVQEESLIAMKYFHKICMDNKIRYTMHGGSLLGAVREKGFIPWDDDIDLAMTRKEYEKFLVVLQNMTLDEGYFYDTTTYETLHFCLRREGRPLVWITVFVYDYISEKKFLQKLKIFWMGILLLRMNTKEEILANEKNSGIKGKIKIMLEYLIWRVGRFKTREAGLKAYDHFCRTGLNGKRRYIHRANDVYIPTGSKLVLPVGVMKKYTLVPFEDTKVMISTSYHDILVASYGPDYMTPIRDYTKEEVHGKVREALDNDN